MGAVRDEISPAVARALARELTAAWPEFPLRRFTAGIAGRLEPLSAMARIELLADRLTVTLPEPFVESSRVLYRTLASPTFTGWMTVPCGSFVARRGIDLPSHALPILAALTPRWSSEFALRPFIEQHADLTYDHLRTWATDADEHVRRLVSEATRPRLPWAPQLRRLIADPTPNVPLLDQLADDPSPYVRRSVANHLNDIAKDHPDLAVALAQRWQTRSEHGAWIARLGLRTLVKQGRPDALAALGVRHNATVLVNDLTIDNTRVSIGQMVSVRFIVELVAGPPADVVIDYRVHYVGVRAIKAPKVFKLLRRHLDPGVPVVVNFTHRFAHVSIRRINPGPHTIDIQVNGTVLGSVTVDVTEVGRR